MKLLGHQGHPKQPMSWFTVLMLMEKRLSFHYPTSSRELGMLSNEVRWNTDRSVHFKDLLEMRSSFSQACLSLTAYSVVSMLNRV